MVEFVVIPPRLALINIDVQNCFVSDSPLASPEAPRVVHEINRLAAACRSAGILVVHVRHVLCADGSDAGVLAEIAPIVRQGIIARGSRSAEFSDTLVIDPRDVLLDKPRFGAFHNTDLERQLRSRGIDSVMISGISTSICCETTAREATVRDFRVFFVSDATATGAVDDLSADQVKRAVCASLGRMFAHVLHVDEMIAKIEAARSSVAIREDRS